MKASLATSCVVALAIGLGLAACSATPDDVNATANADLSTRPARRGFLPKQHASAAPRDADPNAASTQLKYYGGPVIPNVAVHAVYWGRNVAFQSHLNDFYSTIPSSNYLDWLSEYDTPTAHIGRGSFVGGTVIQPSHTSNNLTDEDIQAELAAQIDAGNLPAPDGKNDLFMVHFPPSVSITAGTDVSCVQFCAYHSTFQKADHMVFYGVMPDVKDTDCAQGCGGSAAQDNETSVASHEMVEAITDPAVGLAPDGPPVAPMAWYNDPQGEIGDICNARQGHSNGFTVQLQWSNRQGKCALSGPAN
jgi:hypothetical protein